MLLRWKQSRLRQILAPLGLLNRHAGGVKRRSETANHAILSQLQVVRRSARIVADGVGICRAATKPMHLAERLKHVGYLQFVDHQDAAFSDFPS